MDYPAKYKPGSSFKSEAPLRELMFAIGIDDGNGSYGMTHGPVPDLKEMLDIHSSDGSVIIRYNPDRTDDVIYRWSSSYWLKVDLNDPAEFDWDTRRLKPLVAQEVRRPVTTSDVKDKTETWQERVMRMLYPLERFVASCSMCSLGRKLCNEHKTTFDPHVFSNLKPSRWVVIGQNPGFNECIQHEPFVGEAGKFFDKYIKVNGLSRDDFYISNTVRCHTVGNERPTSEHMERCEPILRMELGILRPCLVITLGSVAFEVICPGRKMSDYLGEIVESEKFKVKVYPIYHPSPQNMQVEERKVKFIEDIGNLCALIKAYNSKI